MPYLAFLAAVMLAAAAASPAAADHRGKTDGSKYSYTNSAQGENRKRLKRREARVRGRTCYRHGKYCYSYPYSRWWGPFAGPPGL